MAILNSKLNSVSGVATATDGTLLDLNSLAQTLSYTASKLDYIEVTVGGNTYRQTFTWTVDDLTAISAWIKQ